MKVQLIKDENYETLYLEGKAVAAAHSLTVEDVLFALLPKSDIDIVDLDEDFDDSEFTSNDKGDQFIDGIMTWENGEGHPKEFPWEIN